MNKRRVSFRVYPDRAKTCYYVVYIFRTEAEMFNHFQRTNIDPQMDTGKLDFLAVCQGWDRFTIEAGKRRKRHPEIGQILFCVGQMGAGIVSHELTHATTYWAGRRTKLRFADLHADKATDERYAWAQGHMVSQFWTKFWERRKQVKWLKA
jgi:hypothetical protein